MTRFITVKRKYFVFGGVLLAVALLSIAGINLLSSSQTITLPKEVEAEMKIVSIDFSPPISIRDLNYGEEVYKGLQIMPKTNFKVSAVIQNMTENTVTNVPIKLTVHSLENKSEVIVKEGNLPILEPGATAKIAFENIQALGDAKGKSATAGQHELILAIAKNAGGALTQNTEARIIFNVDSSVK